MPIELMLLSIFVLCLLSFHLLWVVYLPKPAVFWHGVDYVWLCIALVAVIPQMLEIRHVLAGYDEQNSGGDAILSHHNLQQLSGPILPCRQFPGADARAVCEWKEAVYERFGGDLPETPANLGGGELPRPPAVSDSGARAEIALVASAHRRYAADVERWREAYERVQPSSLSTFMMVASPFLLVFAVALRITKVSAQIRAERARTAPAAPAAADPPPAAAAPADASPEPPNGGETTGP
jgi:hypothetical protein